MAFGEHLGIDDDGLPPHTCDWCGGPKVSIWWSGWTGQYCSCRCSAAANYTRSIVLSVVFAMMASLLGLILLMGALRYPSVSPMHPILMIPLTTIVIIDIMFIYCAYLGRVLTKKDKSESDSEIGSEHKTLESQGAEVES